MKLILSANTTPYPSNKGRTFRSCHILALPAKKHSISLAYGADDFKGNPVVSLVRTACNGQQFVCVHLNQVSAKLHGGDAYLVYAAENLAYGQREPQFPEVKQEVV